MTDQAKSSILDLLLEINDHRKNLKTQENQKRSSDAPSGIGLVELSAGDQRRVFNEGIKNYGEEGKKIHDKFNNELLSKVEGSSELENLAKGLQFPVTEDMLNKIDKILSKVDSGLKEDPRWNDFWKDQQTLHGSMTDTELEKIKEAILNGYRFKVIQMVGFNLAKERPQIVKEYSNLMQTINGARTKQATGEIDANLSLASALAIHISQSEYSNKITPQDYLNYNEGKISALPNDKNILPIFGAEIANQAFKQAIANKSKDKEFFHKSIAQAMKNSNSEEIEKLNKELTELTGKSLTAADILTKPIYFDTPVYKTLAERSDKDFHIAENTDFAKFYHDFKEGRLTAKNDDEIKVMVKEFLEGSGEAFSVGAKSEINISDIDKKNIQKIINAEGPLDKDNLKKALDPAYTQVKGMLTADENLKKVDMKAVLTLVKPKLEVSAPLEKQPRTIMPQSENKRFKQLVPEASISAPQRLGKAIVAFFKSGFSLQAARAAYLEGVGPQLPISRPAVSNFLPSNMEVATPKQRIDMAEKLGDMLSPINSPKKEDPTVDLASPYKKVSFSLSASKMGMPPLTKDAPDLLRSNMLNFLNTFEVKGKELGHVHQQLGQAVIQIASGEEPKGVIRNLELSIEVTKEIGIKDPQSIKVLDNLEKNLANFKERAVKLETTSTEPKQTTEPVSPKSKRTM